VGQLTVASAIFTRLIGCAVRIGQRTYLLGKYILRICPALNIEVHELVVELALLKMYTEQRFTV